jgi:hypothetical protein
MFHIHIHSSTISVTYSSSLNKPHKTRTTPNIWIGKMFTTALIFSAQTSNNGQMHFKEKIEASFYKSLKKLNVYWCTHVISALMMTTMITLQKVVTHELGTLICITPLAYTWLCFSGHRWNLFTKWLQASLNVWNQEEKLNNNMQYMER